MGERAVDPFLIQGPALISFSGGRTSAYMLSRILQAHGGTLPRDVIPVFDNTGKELERTLRFVHECDMRWSAGVRWLEWRDGERAYEVVGYKSASRNGEPFAALIAKRGIVPNSVARFCSVTLKVRASREFVRHELGWKSWVNAIGLRHDEGHRVLKALARNASNKEPFNAVMPLATAGITRADVLRFWLGPTMRMGAGLPQGFDLGLRDYEGNCDMCFLKRRGKLLQLERDRPGRAAWWAAQEAAAQRTAEQPETGGVFRLGDSYAAIQRDAAAQTVFPFMSDDDEGHDAECGDMCGGDTPAEIVALQAEFERGAA